MDEVGIQNLKLLLDPSEDAGGSVMDLNICHIWYDKDTGKQVPYNGKILKRMDNQTFKVCYWGKEESYKDREDYLMGCFALAADLINGILFFFAKPKL
jgi:hypothetical protein